MWLNADSDNELLKRVLSNPAQTVSRALGELSCSCGVIWVNADSGNELLERVPSNQAGTIS